eukprot:c9748_g2_i2.p1 GENE.c9748_g2_i2~~c9748_g2_i2.p1  ORF type:complete len:579 (+),score=134.23 c9748_g2_i2:258-1994(+)
MKRCVWTEAEDELLRRLVNTHGPKKWSLMAFLLENKTGKQCRERWHNQLNPDVLKGPWTKEEDDQVMKLVDKYGTKWACIARHVKGRTDNAIKNRYNSSLKKIHASIRLAAGALPVEDNDQYHSEDDDDDDDGDDDESPVRVDEVPPAASLKRKRSQQQQSKPVVNQPDVSPDSDSLSPQSTPLKPEDDRVQTSKKQKKQVGANASAEATAHLRWLVAQKLFNGVVPADLVVSPSQQQLQPQSQQQQQQSKPVTVPPTDAMGLLGLLDAPSQPSVNKAHTRPDLDFLFDTPATQTPPMMPDTSVAASSPSSYSSHLSPEMTTSAFSSLLSPAASSTTQSAHEGGTVVASSNEIQVSMSKALVHSDLVITATIANHGGVPVRTLTVLFDASSMPAFKVTVASPSGGAVSGCRVTFPFLQAQSSVSVAATLGLTSPTLVLPLSSVRCQFQFTVGDPGRLVPLHHSLPLTIADFMRPATITEQEFGSLWPKHTQERKFTVTNPSIGDPTGFIAKLAEVARVGHVRTIRSEVIACGTDVANKHCLIHSRVASGRADLTVRTLDVKFSDAVQRVCMAGMNASL